MVGPTASGKSEVAEGLAERFGAVVVSVDSMQVYRSMDIGTAKPTMSVRERVDYRMIDIADPSEEMHAARFQDLGRSAIAEGLESHGRVIIAGGSGLHFRSLVDPMTFAPHDESVRDRFASLARDQAKEQLSAIDPGAGDVVDMANPRRVVRALEVHELTGATPSQRYATPEASALRTYTPEIPFLGFGYDPGPASAARVRDRFIGMLDAGLVAEVTMIGSSLGRTASQAVGYREILDVVSGRTSLDEATEAAIGATNALVKRQRTYFR
ncbi:MAG: tRNA (adenosine(37)-N6)-dimethylallyltransferase MiaA, partial [Acidimicrobiia bacterium]